MQTKIEVVGVQEMRRVGRGSTAALVDVKLPGELQGKGRVPSPFGKNGDVEEVVSSMRVLFEPEGLGLMDFVGTWTAWVVPVKDDKFYNIRVMCTQKVK